MQWLCAGDSEELGDGVNPRNEAAAFYSKTAPRGLGSAPADSSSGLDDKKRKWIVLLISSTNGRPQFLLRGRSSKGSPADFDFVLFSVDRLFITVSLLFFVLVFGSARGKTSFVVVENVLLLCRAFLSRPWTEWNRGTNLSSPRKNALVREMSKSSPISVEVPKQKKIKEKTNTPWPERGDNIQCTKGGILCLLIFYNAHQINNRHFPCISCRLFSGNFHTDRFLFHLPGNNRISV